MFQYLRSVLFITQMYIAMPIIGLIFAPWALFDKRGAYAACKGYSCYVFWTARWMVGLRCEVRGTPPGQEALIAAKHQSFLDIMMIFTALPAGKFIMKKEILWTPIIGLYAWRLGCVPVARGKRGAAIKKMMADVKSGRVEPGQLVIYPQGTRVRPGDYRPFKVGSFVLYKQLEQSCVPTATNAGIYWRKGTMLRLPGTAVVEFLPVINPGVEQDDFMGRLEYEVETGSNALMREAGFDGELPKPGQGL